MSSIDTLLLGMVMKKEMSAYDLQREVEKRNINRWVRISTPSIYKKMVAYQKKGFVSTKTMHNDKTMYTLTEKGKQFYTQSVKKVAEKDVNLFFDFNAVITNFDNFTLEEQRLFLLQVNKKTKEHLLLLKDNQQQKRTIPDFGKQIFKQQLVLLTDLNQWIEEYIKKLDEGKGEIVDE